MSYMCGELQRSLDIFYVVNVESVDVFSVEWALLIRAILQQITDIKNLVKSLLLF